MTGKNSISSNPDASREPAVLSVRDVDITYYSGKVKFPAIRKASFEIGAGEAFGLVGESGSGKSTLAYAVMQYLASNGKIAGGEIAFSGTNLMKLSSTELLGLRGLKISMVPQDPLTSLNPSHRVGDQVSEILKIHFKLSQGEAHKKAVEMLGQVHLPAPDLTALKYPHQISGGQQQRVLIAMAFCTNPELLIMDEPTTGLDVTTQARILDLIREMKKNHKTAILYITHDLGVVKNLCDRVGIIYAGEIVEEGNVASIFLSPAHPYTRGLLNCIPKTYTHKTEKRLDAIEGFIPNLAELKPSCIFSPRCKFVQEQCRRQAPPFMEIGLGRRSKCYFTEFKEQVVDDDFEDLRASSPSKRILVTVDHLKKVYPTKRGDLRAVDDTSFECKKGEIMGIVGESGCGKTTMARCIVGLEDYSAGTITFDDQDIGMVRKRSKEMRRKIQMVFQNPEATLNPQKTVEEIVTRPLALYNVVPKARRRQRAIELLESVNLTELYLSRYPHEISGGEKQRVGIARAFATEPELIILDEPISSLDVSVQAGVLNLLFDLQKKHHIAYIFIGHNLSVIRHLCNRVIIVYMGRLCEIGSPDELFEPPYHPYTEALLSAIPVVEPDIDQREIRLEGAMPNAIDPMPGCAFHTRCPRKIGDICVQSAPAEVEVKPGHKITCHIPVDELSAVDPMFKFGVKYVF
jgi:peptide/nickel transport system ATP-binding protein